LKSISESCRLGVPRGDMSHEIPPLEYLIFRGNTSGLKAGLQSDPNMTESKLSKKSGKPSFPQTIGGNE
jgi:hypothetical protein